MISQALRKHQTIISRHLNDYSSDQKVTSENEGSDSHLNELQTKQYATVNGESIIDFGLIKEQYKANKLINLMVDGDGYQLRETVKSKAKEFGIILRYLPSYRPNLNPIERLWKLMSEYARNNKYFSTSTDFLQSINHFFDETLPKIGYALDSRINDNFQTFDFDLDCLIGIYPCD